MLESENERAIHSEQKFYDSSPICTVKDYWFCIVLQAA
jgi:hypothetical protein